MSGAKNRVQQVGKDIRSNIINETGDRIKQIKDETKDLGNLDHEAIPQPRMQKSRHTWLTENFLCLKMLTDTLKFL